MNDNLVSQFSTTTSKYEPLAHALAFVAGRCDGAVSNDGEGFRGQDVLFGHRVVNHLPVSTWDDALAREVWRTLRVYTRQLAAGGIDFRDLPVPTVPVGEGETADAGARDVARQAARKVKRAPSLDLDGADFIFTNVYDVKDALKAATGARWDGAQKMWRVPVAKADAVLAFSTTVDLVISDTAEALLVKQDADEKAEPVENERKVVLAVDCAVITGPLDKDMLAAVRVLPGRKFHKEAKVNLVSVGQELLDFALKFGFDGVADIKGRMAAIAHAKVAEVQRAASAEVASRAESTTREVAMSDYLYPYQQAGVEYIVDLAGGRALLADEQGLGKTAQAIASIETMDAYPALVVCKASLKGNWRREYQKIQALGYAEGKTIQVLKGRTPVAITGDIVIVNFDIMHSWADALVEHNFQAVVVDESHKIKDEKARWTPAVQKVCRAVPDNGLVLLMTGTPVVNRPIELITQLEAIGMLRIFGKKVDFKRAFCMTDDSTAESGVKQYNGSNNLELLNRTLRQHCYVRRLKADVLKDLPAKLRSPQFITLDDEALREYRKVEKNVVQFLAEYRGMEAAEKAQGRAQAIIRLNILRQMIGKAKIDNDVQFVKDHVESTDRPIVIFAWHKEVQQALLAGLAEFAPAHLLGGMTEKDIEANKARFMGGETKVIVCSMTAHSEGHTLTAASDVLLVEQGWHPGLHSQCEDRIHRIGATGEHVTAHYLLAEGTIDERIYDLIEAKRVVVNAVTEGHDADASGSIVDDLIDSLLDG